MIALVATVLFWSVLATVMACLEIEVEGKFGWAQGTQTWYRTTGFWAKSFGKLTCGKPLTGYHVFVLSLTFLIFHDHLFFDLTWLTNAVDVISNGDRVAILALLNRAEIEEFRNIAMFLVWCAVWDYFWFVLNREYKGKFKRHFIWWHSKKPWVFGLFPQDYLFELIFSFGFIWGVARCSGSMEPLLAHLKLVIGFIPFTILLHLVAPAYHRWNAKMHLTDDRDKAGITHMD